MVSSRFWDLASYVRRLNTAAKQGRQQGGKMACSSLPLDHTQHRFKILLFSGHKNDFLFQSSTKSIFKASAHKSYCFTLLGHPCRRDTSVMVECPCYYNVSTQSRPNKANRPVKFSSNTHPFSPLISVTLTLNLLVHSSIT